MRRPRALARATALATVLLLGAAALLTACGPKTLDVSSGQLTTSTLAGYGAKLAADDSLHLDRADRVRVGAALVAGSSLTAVVNAVTTPFAPSAGVVTDPTLGLLAPVASWRALIRECAKDSAVATSITTAYDAAVRTQEQAAQSNGYRYAAGAFTQDPSLSAFDNYRAERLRAFIGQTTGTTASAHVDDNPWPPILLAAGKIAADPAKAASTVVAVAAHAPGSTAKRTPATYSADPQRLSSGDATFTTADGSGVITGLLPVTGLSPAARTALLTWLRDPAVQVQLDAADLGLPTATPS